MNAFEIGQNVKSNSNAQGMKKGERFTVSGVCEEQTPFGRYMAYTVKNEQKELQIVNAHLLLRLA